MTAASAKKLAPIHWREVLRINNKPNSLRVSALDGVGVVLAMDTKINFIVFFWLEKEIVSNHAPIAVNTQ